MSFWSFKVSGLEGVWTALELLKGTLPQHRPHVVAVQETCNNADHSQGIAFMPEKLGYTCLSTDGVSMAKRANEKQARALRGLITLVLHSARSAFAQEQVEHEGRAQSRNPCERCVAHQQLFKSRWWTMHAGLSRSWTFFTNADGQALKSFVPRAEQQPKSIKKHSKGFDNRSRKRIPFRNNRWTEIQTGAGQGQSFCAKCRSQETCRTTNCRSSEHENQSKPMHRPGNTPARRPPGSTVKPWTVNTPNLGFTKVYESASDFAKVLDETEGLFLCQTANMTSRKLRRRLMPILLGGLFFFAAGFGFVWGSWFYAFLLLCFSAVLLLCFSASLLLCFSAFCFSCFSACLLLLFLLLCLSTSLLFCFLLFLLFAFPASLLVYFSAFLLLCFSALPASFLFCFSAIPASLLFFFCASVPFYFCHSTCTFFLQPCVFGALLPAPFPLSCLYCLFVFSFLLLYSLLFVSQVKP